MNEPSEELWQGVGEDPLADVDEAVVLMRERLEGGQGGLASSMCRLSLPMSEWLLRECNRLRTELLELRTLHAGEQRAAAQRLNAKWKSEG